MSTHVGWLCRSPRSCCLMGLAGGVWPPHSLPIRFDTAQLILAAFG